jgi:hypothetical protein
VLAAVLTGLAVLLALVEMLAGRARTWEAAVVFVLAGLAWAVLAVVDTLTQR